MPVETRAAGSNGVPQIFTKSTKIEVKPVERHGGDGSLFRLDDGRNGLFTTEEPTVPGSYLTVEVASNHAPAKTPGKGEVAKPKGEKLSDDPEVDALLKALPDLEPAEKTATIVKRFRAKVTHRFDNGDLALLYRRESFSPEETQQLQVKARVPYMRLVSGENLKTTDLVDVEWVENTRGEVVERTSSGWEDEYSVRLSGFDESKSKVALDLDDKRKAVADANEQLKTKLKSMGEERRQFSKQREDMLEGRKKAENELEQARKQMDEQAKEIEKLTPKDDEKKDGEKDKKKDTAKKSG